MCISSNFKHTIIEGSDEEGFRGFLHNISSHIARTQTETGERRSALVAVASLSIVNKRGHCDYGWKSNSKNIQHQRKLVSFSDKVNVKFIKTLQEISPQDFINIWYSAGEYEEITNACCQQIDKLNRGELLKDKKYCARGLESHTRIQSLAKNMNRILAYQAVLNEQDRQLHEGILHEDAIARVYHSVSSSCQLWAHAVALGDQRAAEKNP